MDDDKKGLFCKYHITHEDGTALSPGLLFVLRPDRDPAAWDALRAYAISTHNVRLSGDLWKWLEENPRPGTALCETCGKQATWEFWYRDHTARRQPFCDTHIGETVASATRPYDHEQIPVEKLSRP